MALKIDMIKNYRRNLVRFFNRTRKNVSIRFIYIFLLTAVVGSIGLFQNCSPVGVTAASAVAANGIGTLGNQPPAGLVANNLTFATNVNVPLVIQTSDILGGNTAPAGQSLVLQSVGTPSLGTLTQSGTAYTFDSSVIGSSQLSYSLTDSAGDQAVGSITIKVLATSAATGSFYACNLQANLYVLDPSLGSLQQLVTTTYNGKNIGFNDLAIDASGNMFAKDPSNNIYKVNVSTGVSSLFITALIPTSYYAAGLSFIPDGRLVTSRGNLSTGAYSVVAVDPNTLAETTLVPESAGYQMQGGDIKALPDGYLYWTVTNASTKLCRNSSAGGDQGIVKIDPKTGATTEIACLNEQNIFGLGFANKALYGFSGSGILIQINIGNGNVSIINQTGDTFVGAASNPALW